MLAQIGILVGCDYVREINFLKLPTQTELYFIDLSCCAGASAAYLDLKATCFSYKLFHQISSALCLQVSAALTLAGEFIHFHRISLPVSSRLFGADLKKPRLKY